MANNPGGSYHPNHREPGIAVLRFIAAVMAPIFTVGAIALVLAGAAGLALIAAALAIIAMFVFAATWASISRRDLRRAVQRKAAEHRAHSGDKPLPPDFDNDWGT